MRTCCQERLSQREERREASEAEDDRQERIPVTPQSASTVRRSRSGVVRSRRRLPRLAVAQARYGAVRATPRITQNVQRSERTAAAPKPQHHGEDFGGDPRRRDPAVQQHFV